MTNLYKFQGVQTTVTTDRDGALVGFYRGTPVARLAGDVVTLKTGGWKSRTTKVRMNQFANNFTNGGFKVYQRDYEWLVMVDGGTEPLVFLGDELTFKLGA
jgi:hypothetical protein